VEQVEHRTPGVLGGQGAGNGSGLEVSILIGTHTLLDAIGVVLPSLIWLYAGSLIE
jgi:hypothetical protein